jgi:DNA (cytosine-5)-methyltransferase 1
MNCVELFAGAGGAALGLEAAGISHLACVEIDPDACKTLRAADLPCVEGDVRDPDLYESHWVGCDLLWSSFPCQAWSTAGKRKGAQDERNGWPWTVDAIDCLEPTWFAAENVVGLLNHKGACKQGKHCVGLPECPNAYFHQVIIKQLEERFAWVGYKILNAADFGVPQKRRRIIIVAGPRPIAWPSETHADPSKSVDLFSRSLSAWNTVGAALGLRGQISGSRNSKNNPKQERPASTEEPAPPVTGAGNHMFRVTGGGEVRRLTVDECAILQDFPRGHRFYGTKKSQHTQVGNAVPPKVAEVIGRAIVEANER